MNRQWPAELSTGQIFLKDYRDYQPEVRISIVNKVVVQLRLTIPIVQIWSVTIANFICIFLRITLHRKFSLFGESFLNFIPPI